jgi:hypothetical protein
MTMQQHGAGRQVDLQEIRRVALQARLESVEARAKADDLLAESRGLMEKVDRELAKR